MNEDPYLAATSQLGGGLRGRSIQQILATLQDEMHPADLYSDMSPIQEEEENPISDKVLQFISSLKGGDGEGMMEEEDDMMMG
jgi:hypothetical protein